MSKSIYCVSLVAILSAFEEETRHVKRYIQEENSQAKQFITFVRKEMEERFRRCWEDATLLKATIVDPRYAYSTAVLSESTWDTAEAHLVSWSIGAPPSSVSSERLFSKAGLLFNNKLRANLSGPRAEQCLLLIARNTSETNFFFFLNETVFRIIRRKLSHHKMSQANFQVEKTDCDELEIEEEENEEHDEDDDEWIRCEEIEQLYNEASDDSGRKNSNYFLIS
uniref:Dimer_Tnp_hAT domain-containing protein n=1 Tax=Heterorhabditis bacteriophora TaxID=37862 RepID=A0A1I7WQ15_HETBA